MNRDADTNVTGVWEMGITGKGVVSAVIDDGKSTKFLINDGFRD